MEFGSEQHLTTQVIPNSCKESLVEQQRLESLALKPLLVHVFNQLVRCRLIDDNIGAELGDVLVAGDFPRLEHENIGGRPQAASVRLG